jgi:hypothetical protein
METGNLEDQDKIRKIILIASESLGCGLVGYGTM